MKHLRFICFLTLAASFFVSCKKNSVDLVPVSLDGKWGYINAKGEYAITPRYKDADFFYDGLACVKNMDGCIGYIDKSGLLAIPAKYKTGTMFQEGKAIVVEKGGKPTCIDTKGNVLFVMQTAEKLFTFREGLAAFQDTSKKYGFVDEKGTVVISPKFDDVNLGFSEGLAPVLIEGKWGYIDKSGALVISNNFSGAYPFEKGLAAVQADNQKYGYIGKNGLFKIQPLYDMANSFSDGEACIKLGNKWAGIKTNGDININPFYDYIASFTNGVAVMQLNNMYGYINTNGKMTINAQFAWASDFYDGFAIVRTFDQYGSNRHGVIDKSGTFVAFPDFEFTKNNYTDRNPEDYFVKSDYYDASEFVANFIKKINGNSIDGFNYESTLQTIAKSNIYGDYANASDSVTASAFNIQKLSKDILCVATQFSFSNKIIAVDSTTNTTDFDFSQPINAICYTFSLRNSAMEKGSAIATALGNALASKLGCEKISADGAFLGLQDDNKLSFRLQYDDIKVSVTFAFNKDNINFEN